MNKVIITKLTLSKQINNYNNNNNNIDLMASCTGQPG